MEDPNYKIACLTVMLLFNFRRASANFDFYPKKGKHNFKFEYFKAPLEAKNEKCTDGNTVFRRDSDKNSLVVIYMF